MTQRIPYRFRRDFRRLVQRWLLNCAMPQAWQHDYVLPQTSIPRDVVFDDAMYYNARAIMFIGRTTALPNGNVATLMPDLVWYAYNDRAVHLPRERECRLITTPMRVMLAAMDAWYTLCMIDESPMYYINMMRQLVNALDPSGQSSTALRIDLYALYRTIADGRLTRYYDDVADSWHTIAPPITAEQRQPPAVNIKIDEDRAHGQRRRQRAALALGGILDGEI